MGYSTVRRIMREGLTDPRNLDGIALWNSTRDVTDLTTDTGIKLWADKSGNSSTNVLCLNGVAGNYASAPDSAALSITGDIDIRVRASMPDWTPTNYYAALAKYTSTGNQRSYALGISSGATGNLLDLAFSTNGTAITTKRSTVAPTVSDYATLWIRVTLDVDNGAGGYDVKFWTADGSLTSPTASDFTQLGTTVTTATPTSIFNSTAILEIGSVDVGTGSNFVGNIYRAQVYSGIDGTLAFDSNFALPAKLATSFTESSSNAATVTINSTGATGARISGARDLYQGTAANQPILTIAAAGNYLTFDGSNDFLKAAAFALAQPETVYFVGSQVTFTNGDAIYAGNVNGAMVLYQDTTTPNLSIFSGSTTGTLTDVTLATTAILSSVHNGASSSNRKNRGAAATGNSGAAAANGFTLGAQGTGGSAWANITAQEVVVYSTAQDENYQYRVTRLLSRRTGVLVA